MRTGRCVIAAVCLVAAVLSGPSPFGQAQESSDTTGAPQHPVSGAEASDLLAQTLPEALAPARATSLDPDGDVLEATVAKNGARTATVGQDPRDGFTLVAGSEPLVVTPADVGPEAAPARLVNREVAVFANTGPATDTAIRPAGAGIETFTQARNAAAPQDFSWNVSLEPQASLVSTDDGGIAVQDAAGDPRAAISPPVAVDAAGSPVPTSVRAEGATVILRVEHQSGGVQYPVVADPVWTKIATFDLSNGDARTLGRALRKIADGSTLAGALVALPHPVAKVFAVVIPVVGNVVVAGWSDRVLDAVGDAGPRQHICVRVETSVQGFPPVPIPNVAAGPRTTGRCS